MRRTRPSNAGRPRISDRCPCGASSHARAIAREFDCCKRAGVIARKTPENTAIRIANGIAGSFFRAGRVHSGIPDQDFRQHCIVLALEALRKFDSSIGAPLEKWISLSVHNGIRHFFRTWTRREGREFEGIENAPTPAYSAVAVRSEVMFLEFLRLSTTDQTIAAHAFGGDILGAAKALGLTLNEVKSRMQQIRSRIEQEL